MAEEVTGASEEALGPAAMGFDRNRVVLMLPEPGEHGPTEAQGKERDEFTQALAMAEVGGFEVKASGFEGRKQGLDAPGQAVIGQGGLGMMVGRENEEFAIGEAGGDDVDSSAPDPTLPR
jgi:hypothetical protein